MYFKILTENCVAVIIKLNTDYLLQKMLSLLKFFHQLFQLSPKSIDNVAFDLPKNISTFSF